MTPRRLVIGIATRVYSDGRKREELLVRLSRNMSLATFRFRIFGSGWDSVVPHLSAAGAEVDYDPGSSDYVADYARLAAAMPHFDYYLYPGMDEGSLGTLDALAAGVPTIVTPQGFHLDLLPALWRTFVEYEDLEAVLKTIVREREVRLQAASKLDWPSFARRHSIVWRAAFAGRPEAAAAELAADLPAAGVPPPDLLPRGRARYYARILSPRRMLSALSHLQMLKPVKRVVRNVLNRSK
jgi:glycosyltransferase involved in cell wall biosynthesis